MSIENKKEEEIEKIDLSELLKDEKDLKKVIEESSLSEENKKKLLTDLKDEEEPRSRASN